MISLRWRLVAVLNLRLAFTGVAWAWMAMGIAFMAEDRILERRLILAVADHQQHIHQSLLSQKVTDQDAVSQRIRRDNRYAELVHESSDDLIQIGVIVETTSGTSMYPAEWSRNLIELPQGNYEWQQEEPNNPWPGRDVLLAIVARSGDLGTRILDNAESIEKSFDKTNRTSALPTESVRWIYRYDTTDLESNPDEQQRLVWFILLTAAGLGASCIVLAWLLGRWLTAPLKQLSSLVAFRSPEESESLSSLFPPDEIGALARSFDQHHQRIQELLERERAFTQHASHELRTPLTVMEGALDVVAIAPQLQEKAIQRMRRACQNMRQQIDTFLALARETSKHQCEIQQLATLAEQTLQPHILIAQELSIALTISISSDSGVRAPPRMIAIVMDNLVRNAFQHRTEGEISFHLTEGTLTVSNHADTATIPDNLFESGVSGNHSSGHGLAIIKRLCDHCDWKLNWQATSGIFQISVNFTNIA